MNFKNRLKQQQTGLLQQLKPFMKRKFYERFFVYNNFSITYPKGNAVSTFFHT